DGAGAALERHPSITPEAGPASARTQPARRPSPIGGRTLRLAKKRPEAPRRLRLPTSEPRPWGGQQLRPQRSRSLRDVVEHQLSGMDGVGVVPWLALVGARRAVDQGDLGARLGGER